MKPANPPEGQKATYLDYAAATPIDPDVLKAMQPYFSGEFFNPSSLYRAARNVKNDIESARSTAANVLGVKPSEIIFTAGATESVNLAILGVARKHPKGKILALATEHHAVLNCLKIAESEGHQTVLIPVDIKGRVDLAKLEKMIDDKTVLISIAFANNEIGTIQPITKIAAIVKQKRAHRKNSLPLYLHTDASAAAAYLPLSVDRLGVDLLSLGGNKIYGPSQSGILYLRRGIELAPLLAGGGQEKGLRAGTENAASIVGLATAVEVASRHRDADSKRIEKLRTAALTETLKLTGVQLNGDPKNRLPGNINLSIEGVDGETMVLYLDEAGIQVSTGAACTIGSAEPSHVLLALGLTSDQANSNLRITFGRQTSESDIKQLTDTLPRVIERVRQLKRS